MCGIAGWVRHAPGGPDPSPSAVADSIRHRGPDDAGHVAVDGAHLVFRRLALLDLDRGQQPVSDEGQRYWSVFNGEIYNHAELRSFLRGRGHELHGSGDAELVPHLYEEDGPDLVHRLRGMFAIAVYDRDRQELALMRDPFGIKPLFVVRTATHTVFGSEVRAISAAIGRPDPNPTALWDYLSFGYVPEPQTMWAGVTQLPAGHVARIRAGRQTQQRYWAPAFHATGSADIGADIGADIRADIRADADAIAVALADSVSAHLDADVEVGAYLSSGVDSSLVTALARHAGPLQTFSVGFEHSGGGGGATGVDELRAARQTADLLGTRHHEVRVSATEWLDRLPDIVAAQEQPLADPSAPALWFLARAASRTVKAVLSGEGADELFGGYPLYRQARTLRPVTALPGRASSWLHAGAERLPLGLKGREYLLRGTTPLERRFLGNAPLFDDATKRRLLGVAAPRDAPRPSHELLHPTYEASRSAPVLDRMQLASISSWLPGNILAKADRMGMAHSLEVRVPFLDRVVFDTAARLPVAHRVDGSVTKVALRAAAATLLPAETAGRHKLGFPVPFRSWLDGGAGTLLRDLSAASTQPDLDPRVVAEVCADTRRADRYQRQWALLTYLLWRHHEHQGSSVSACASSAD